MPQTVVINKKCLNCEVRFYISARLAETKHYRSVSKTLVISQVSFSSYSTCFIMFTSLVYTWVVHISCGSNAPELHDPGTVISQEITDITYPSTKPNTTQI